MMDPSLSLNISQYAGAEKGKARICVHSTTIIPLLALIVQHHNRTTNLKRAAVRCRCIGIKTSSMLSELEFLFQLAFTLTAFLFISVHSHTMAEMKQLENFASGQYDGNQFYCVALFCSISSSSSSTVSLLPLALHP